MDIVTFGKMSLGNFLNNDNTITPTGQLQLGKALHGDESIPILDEIEAINFIQETEVVDSLKNNKIDIQLTDGTLEIDKTGSGEYEEIANLDSRYEQILPAGVKDDDMLFYDSSRGAWIAVEDQNAFGKLMELNTSLGSILINESVIY